MMAWKSKEVLKFVSFLLLEYFFVFPSVLVITATVGLSGLPVALRQKILPKVASVLTCVHDYNTWAPLIFAAADGFVVQTGDPEGPAEGFIDPSTEKSRTIPLEIMVEGEKSPFYGATLEVSF